jgi:alpha-1,6-mannosyltransferase
VRHIIIRGGAATLAALIVLAVSQAPLGSPLFFALTAVPCVVYGLLLRHVLVTPPDEDRSARLPRLLVIALVLAAAFRVPLAAPRVGADNDMVRYMYDGRLQRLGYNPFEVVPADPAVAGTHTDETRRMPSIRARTPYPAAAQLFFRAVVTIRESSRAMKWALVVCDLLTIWVLIAWLRDTRRSPWLALVYAWNPLVILEVAHSGHIDALGALWIAISAWMLSTGRGMRAAIAFVLAVATKLLPIVLVPLYWKRIRFRDAAVAALVLAALYFPFRSAGLLPLGAVPNVVAFIRFNGPVFKWLALTFDPQKAAAFALLTGLAVAAWMRFRRSAGDPAAWAWPMAVSLAAAPVIYPWYLLYFTPFLFTRAATPLIAWTYSVLPVYIVWHLSKSGHRWFVPAPVVAVEFGLVAVVLMVLMVRRGAKGAGAEGAGGEGPGGAPSPLAPPAPAPSAPAPSAPSALAPSAPDGTFSTTSTE